MKQLLQNLRDGKTEIVEVPIPKVQPGNVLVKNINSLVSAGTERMVIEFAEKSLIKKAQSRPDLVRQVINKARNEGIISTIEATFNRLDQPMPLGYSSAGIIVEVGKGVNDFHPGDRVACAGGGHAVHAEYIVVPSNLVIGIPENVTFETASFATLGAIALHGFRLSNPQVGSSVAVIGLGLLGLLSAMIARASGCNVIGIDTDPERVSLAQSIGIKAHARSESEKVVASLTKQYGVDITLICADTKSNDPIEMAGVITRDKGQVVAIGAVGLHIPRKLFYEKELVFQVSRSYGPGRYDQNYEGKGIDYPYGFVRWTENRNIAAFIDLMANGLVDVSPLITHRFPISEAPAAYDLITRKISGNFLGVVISYPNSVENISKITINSPALLKNNHTRQSLGVLGAGNYARAVFLPIISKSKGLVKHSIASATGLNAVHAAKKFQFQFGRTNDDDLIVDPSIDIIAILTRHNLHASQACAALDNNKSVYCEKPLAINQEELAAVINSMNRPDAPILTVGFNRRFAPLGLILKEAFSKAGEPFHINYRINAGFLPKDHWLHDPEIGGGRIIGEGCHFIDFLTFITGALPTTVLARSLPDAGKYQQDNLTITLTYPDGSLGMIHYLANGNKTYPKERIEIFSGGIIGVLDDFRSLKVFQTGRTTSHRSYFRQDKGHSASWNAFLESVRCNNGPPIPYHELIGVTMASFAVLDSLGTFEQVNLNAPSFGHH